LRERDKEKEDKCAPGKLTSVWSHRQPAWHCRSPEWPGNCQW